MRHRCFFSSPGNQLHAHILAGCNVLFSFGARNRPVEHPRWSNTFGEILIDSGAYSELNNPKIKIELPAYGDYVAQWSQRAVACAGLDHIRGDWRKSMKNYEALPTTFPTFHDADPPELLAELVAMAQERGRWLGLGVVPKHARCSRVHARRWVQRCVEQIPTDIHVHGWALGGCADIVDSYDSINWILDSRKIMEAFPWMSPGEALGIVVRRNIRRSNIPKEEEQDGQGDFTFGRD